MNDSQPRWNNDGRLVFQERVLASYNDGSQVDRQLSQRPYLEHISALNGAVLSDAFPEDHLHHLGLSVAIPDVDGTSYWGGRTFVRDQGSTMLENHGQQLRKSIDINGGQLTEQLQWINEHGDLQLHEDRELSAGALPGGWSLCWKTRLWSDSAWSVGSPATNGRPGAGYGGIFWRFETAAVELETETGAVGTDGVHEAYSKWVRLRFMDRSADVYIVQSDPVRPWFIRTDQYLGLGPSLAATERLEVSANEKLDLGLGFLVFDEFQEGNSSLVTQALSDLVQQLGA